MNRRMYRFDSNGEMGALGNAASGVPVGRCSLPVAVSIIFLDRSLQPLFDEVQYVAVYDPTDNAFHQLCVRDAMVGRDEP